MIDDDTRLATPDDRSAFLQLASAYLVDLRELGSEVRPTPTSLNFYQLLFEITTEDADCDSVVIVLAGDFGFCVASEMGAPMIETDFGRTAFGHGTYVKPEYRKQGWSRRLRDRMREELKSRGFETILGGVHLKNDLGAKSLSGLESTFTWYQLVGYEKL